MKQTQTPVRNTHFKTLQIIRIYRLLRKFLPRKAFGRYVHGKGAKRKSHLIIRIVIHTFTLTNTSLIHPNKFARSLKFLYVRRTLLNHRGNQLLNFEARIFN